MNARTAHLERYAALLERVTVLKRALEKISVIADTKAARENPRVALYDIRDIADRALDG
jgi:hypothetical protein